MAACFQADLRFAAEQAGMAGEAFEDADAPETEFDPDYGECDGLRSVDDLEVAQLAAEADLARLALLHDAAPRRSQAGVHSSNEEDDSAVEAMDTVQEEAGPSAQSTEQWNAFVGVRLQATGDGVAVQLSVREPAMVIRDVEMDDEDDESAGGDDDDEEDIESIHDLADVMRMVMAPEEAKEAAHQGPLHGVEGLDAVKELDVKLADSDEIHLAGRLSSIVHGMLVIAGLENSPALDQGTLLCTEDREVIGLIEDVFGPVMMPMYTLRYQGPGEMPPAVQPGLRVFAVSKMTVHVDHGAIQQGGVAVADGDDADEDDADSQAHSDTSCRIGDGGKKAENGASSLERAASAPMGGGGGYEWRGGVPRGGRGGGRWGVRGGGKARDGMGRGVGGRGRGRYPGGMPSPQYYQSWQMDAPHMHLAAKGGRHGGRGGRGPRSNGAMHGGFNPAFSAGPAFGRGHSMSSWQGPPSPSHGPSSHPNGLHMAGQGGPSQMLARGMGPMATPPGATFLPAGISPASPGAYAAAGFSPHSVAVMTPVSPTPNARVSAADSLPMQGFAYAAQPAYQGGAGGVFVHSDGMQYTVRSDIASGAYVGPGGAIISHAHAQGGLNPPRPALATLQANQMAGYSAYPSASAPAAPASPYHMQDAGMGQRFAQMGEPQRVMVPGQHIMPGMGQVHFVEHQPMAYTHASRPMLQAQHSSMMPNQRLPRHQGGPMRGRGPAAQQSGAWVASGGPPPQFASRPALVANVDGRMQPPFAQSDYQAWGY